MEQEQRNITEQCKEFGIDEYGNLYKLLPLCLSPQKQVKDYGYSTNSLHPERPVWSK